MTTYNLITTTVPEGVIYRPPLYPGCENELGLKNQKSCLSTNISKLVMTNFDTNFINSLGLTGKQKIKLYFKINKKGKVVSPCAVASHPKLEDEAIRVINLLPNMKPGKIYHKTVKVPYALPIIFQIKN